MEEEKVVEKRVSIGRSRLLWILIVAVWLFVILKALVGNFFEKNTSLVSAFSVTNPEEMSATVEVTAEYFGEEIEQKILETIAEKIQLRITEEPQVIETSSRKEMSYMKQAKMAKTDLRVIKLMKEDVQKEYVYAKIELQNSVEAIVTYKRLLEEAMQELACENISTTIQLVGDYVGYLTVDRRNEVTDKILDALGASIVYEHREQDLYTIYAYTASLDNYITVEDRKINVHVAMSQDEENYRTILYLASPILPDTW